MVGMKNQIDASLFVFTIEFRISVLMANQCTTSNAIQIENGKMISRAVMREIADLAIVVSSAEHFVVSVDEFSVVINDVKTVVRLVASHETMRRPEDKPELKFSRQIEHTTCALRQ